MPKTSPIWKVPKTRLQKILDASNSYNDVLRKLHLTESNYKTLKQRIKDDNLETTKLDQNRETKKTEKKAINEILIKNSTYTRTHLKKRLIDEELLEYKCTDCGNKGEWNGKPLSLQLDHINGVNNDNRLENLRFLCPNCHAQTDTFTGKKLKKEKHCPLCNVKINKWVKHCRKCKLQKLGGNGRRKFNVSKEELEKLISKHSYVHIGAIFGVNGNSIKKRAKTLGIELKPRRAPDGQAIWNKKNT